MNDAIELIAVFLLRVLQAVALCLPTLLCGMIVAGVARAVVGRENVLAWLGRGTRGDLLRAYVIAFFLPVCSIGVWPVLLTLRSMGVRCGPLVVLAIAGPLVTPWTLGYLLDRTGPLAFAMVIASNAAIALAAGLAVGKVDHQASTPTSESMPTRSRLVNVLWAAGRSLNARALLVIGIGLLGVGALAVCIPPNAVGHWLVEREADHAAIASVVPLFTYVPPELAAMQAGEVVTASTMPGLIVPLIAMGAAVHLGTLVALARGMRWRTALRVIAVAATVGAACGVAIDVAIRDPAYQPEDTHAFEDYGRPFHLLDHPDGAPAGFAHRLTGPLGVQAVWAGAGVLAIVVVGRSLRRRADERLHAFASRRMLRTSGVLITAATLALAIYTYYPPPAALARELRAASAEFAVADRRHEHAEARRFAQRIDRRLAQYSIARALHGQWPHADQRAASGRLREELAALIRPRAEGVGSDERESLAFQRGIAQLTRGLK